MSLGRRRLLAVLLLAAPACGGGLVHGRTAECDVSARPEPSARGTALPPPIRLAVVTLSLSPTARDVSAYVKDHADIDLETAEAMDFITIDHSLERRP